MSDLKTLSVRDVGSGARYGKTKAVRDAAVAALMRRLHVDNLEAISAKRAVEEDRPNRATTKEK